MPDFSSLWLASLRGSIGFLVGRVRVWLVVYVRTWRWRERKQSVSSPNWAPTRRRFRIVCIWILRNLHVASHLLVFVFNMWLSCGLITSLSEIDRETWDNLALLDLRNRIQPVISVLLEGFFFFLFLDCYVIGSKHFVLHVVNNQS